jgi:hypothetical protein
LIQRLVAETAWPDAWVGFARAAIASLISSRKETDLVLCSAQPWSDLLVGYEVNRLTGIPWIADYGDPWSIEWSGDAWTHGPDILVEREILRTAAGVTVTTDATRAAFAKELLIAADRIAVVPAGVPVLDYPPPPPAPPVRIAHAGAVYGPRTSIVPFLTALQERQRDGLPLALSWCGEVSRANERELVKSIAEDYAGHRSSSEVAAIEMRSHITVVFGNAGGVQIPAKIWRLLATNRPMLVVVGGPDDPLRQIPELVGRVTFVDNETAAIGASLDLMVRHALNGTLAKAYAGQALLPNWDDRAAAILALAQKASALSNAEVARPMRLIVRTRTLSRSRLHDLFRRVYSRLRGR